MPNRVDVCGSEFTEEGNRLANGLAVVLDYLKLEDVGLSLMLTGHEETRSLNSTWRAREETTDVLSFPQQEAGEEIHKGALLGDIVLNVERGREQADARKHSLQAELDILAIHGLCHLLGHDHKTQEGAEKMAAVENELLRVMSGAGDASMGLIELTRGEGSYTG
jgi:probable rRNA maturation factor